MIFSPATSRGYSLVEVLVSISILLVAISGPLTIAATGLKNAQFAREQNLAIFMAQEGIEKVNHHRNNFFLDTINNDTSAPWSDWIDDITAVNKCGSVTGCAFTLRGAEPFRCDPIADCAVVRGSAINGPVVYSVSSDSVLEASPEATPYVKQVFVSEVGSSGVVLVRSLVEWDSRVRNRIERVEQQSYLHNIYDL